jgi:hypothetical protein
MLGGVAFGFILGCFTIWFDTLSVRFEKNRLRRTIRHMEKKTAATSGSSAAAKALPALPPLSHVKKETYNEH